MSPVLKNAETCKCPPSGSPHAAGSLYLAGTASEMRAPLWNARTLQSMLLDCYGLCGVGRVKFLTGTFGRSWLWRAAAVERSQTRGESVTVANSRSLVASIRLREEVDGVNHLDVEAALAGPGHELEEASGVGGGHGIGARGCDVV